MRPEPAPRSRSRGRGESARSTAARTASAAPSGRARWRSKSGATASKSCAALVVRINGLVRHDLDNVHHAAVLVREDVAVDDVEPAVIDEAAAHLEVAGHGDGLAAGVLR